MSDQSELVELTGKLRELDMLAGTLSAAPDDVWRSYEHECDELRTKIADIKKRIRSKENLPRLYHYVQNNLAEIPARNISRWWQCQAEDDEPFTSESIVNAYGVSGCHAHRPELYDPDEYDHEHDDCGWVLIVRGNR